MINFLSNCLADFLCKKEIITEERKEIYVYGYQILFSSFFGIVTVLIMSFLLHKEAEGILFLCLFILTRQFTGGFHAKHFYTCFIAFTGTFLCILFFQAYFIKFDYFLYYLFMIIIYVVTVLKYAPMEHSNKPLTEEVRKNSRINSCVLSIVWILLFVFLYRFYHELAIVVVLTLASIAAYLLLEIIFKEVNTQ